MKINERSLVEGLSYALDVAEKTYFSHAKHVAYMSVMIAKELNFTVKDQKDLYFAGLLHDIGASNTYSMLHHCEVGKEIVSKLPLNDAISDYVYYHHENFDGSGPFGIKGDAIPVLAQIINISNSFDIHFRNLKNIGLDEFKKMKLWISDNKNLYSPIIIEAFSNLIEKEFILLDYFNYEFNSVLTNKIDVQGIDLDYDDVVAYARAFSQIIDNRSPFTYRHSKGIANLVNKIILELGYDSEIQKKMYIAALLHDIGKLIIPNRILDKEGKLDAKERYEINKHTYYTRWILNQIEGFEDITNYASNHHEKLNGKGYPLCLDASEIGELERVMAICDIFQALTEDRPYRKTMSLEKVWSIIDAMVDRNELDRGLVEKIKVILVDYNEN